VCGRYTLASIDPAAARARFPIGESVDVRRRYNVAPGDDVLAVTTDREGVPRGELLQWGLVPSWAKTPGRRPINARAETVSERPTFRTAFTRFRCLIPADGFYEWRAAPDGRKEAFHISWSGEELFAFAGIWSVWRPSEEAPQVRSCAILTTVPNEAVAPLHDRMPVILPREAEGAWLDSSSPLSEVSQLLVPIPASETIVQPVGPAVNDTRYDGPECLAPPVPTPQQAALF
jgi:putative SOS response-associated peptidase YedK